MRAKIRLCLALLAACAVSACGSVVYGPVCGDGGCPPDGGCDGADCNAPDVGVTCDGDTCMSTPDAPVVSCGAGSLICDLMCVDAQRDNQNCGACGKACGAGESCSKGVCCSAGKDACGGAVCLDLQTDTKNCGMCGKACADTQDCVSGMCKTACRVGLNSALIDGWGARWDGMERAADTRINAEMTCTSIGGRLPTATELYRVSATQNATIGQSTNVNPLWSQVAQDPLNWVTVQLNNGATTLAVPTSKRNYRCVCPQPQPIDFTGLACNGPPNEPCFALNKRTNMDMQDRAPLPKSAAIWECAQAHGHLAESITYIEAIQSQLPNGSTSWLHTADDGSYTWDVVVKWQNTQPIWAVTGNVTGGVKTDFRPFRCVGSNFHPGPFPKTVANEFVGGTSLYKGETMDNPALAFAPAHDACFNKGGHLARSCELGELIMQGLPNGSGTYLWTSDQAGYYAPSAQFLVSSLSWTGVAKLFKYYYTGLAAEGSTWMFKTTATAAYRCIYYPIDAAYVAPADTDCQGGCVKVAAADSPATMWFDKADRPASNFDSAVATCRLKGGHLASERDLTEAIRKGLPGGSGAWVMTWDISDGPRFAVVKWMASDPNFTDQYPTYATWLDFPGSNPFRCMWTNELR